MKTIEEIKQTVAENRGYDYWEELVEDYIYHGHHKRLDMSIEGVVNIYASQYREKIKVLEVKVESYKELLEKFVPEEKREVTDK